MHNRLRRLPQQTREAREAQQPEQTPLEALIIVLEDLIGGVIDFLCGSIDGFGRVLSHGWRNAYHTEQQQCGNRRGT
jgi:hypothetical protein